MKTLEKQAKTVDEAIELALEELNVSREQADIEILDEGNKGILGFLSKSAKVKVTVKPDPKKIANDFLGGLLKFIDKDVKISSSLCEDGVKMEIEGKNAGIIIGRYGSTLDALQYLTSLVVNRGKNDFTRILLDAENYRSRREKTLERLAHRMADKVKTYRKSVSLEPMHPNERRLIHTALQEDSSIKTKSVGNEPNRRVIISLR